MNVLAIDFGGSSVKYALVDEDGNLSKSGRQKPAPLKTKKQFQETISELYQIFSNDISGISISLPGYIDSKNGFLTGSGAYSNLYGCNIIALVHEAVNLPVTIENDGRCGALAEVWKGGLSDCKDGVVLILGSGIAGGIIKNRQIHSGKHFTAGEFSNYIVDPANPSFLGEAVMNCAAFGLTYRLCKAKNIDLGCQDLGDILIETDQTFGSRFKAFEKEPVKMKVDGKQVNTWLQENDEDAKKVYDHFLMSLAFMIVNIQITYDPEKIIIGGGLSRISHMPESLKDKLNFYYQGTGFTPELQANVEVSRYLDECNLIGAGYHFFSRNEKQKKKGAL